MLLIEDVKTNISDFRLLIRILFILLTTKKEFKK